MSITSRNSPSTAAATNAAAGCVLRHRLSELNPPSAKLAMLYGLRDAAWNVCAGGDVSSYDASLVEAQNGAAAAVTATTIRHYLGSPDLGGHS